MSTEELIAVFEYRRFPDEGAAGAVAGGYFLGSYLDKKLHTYPWLMLLFMILGTVASFIEFFKVTKKLFSENKKEP